MVTFDQSVRRRAREEAARLAPIDSPDVLVVQKSRGRELTVRKSHDIPEFSDARELYSVVYDADALQYDIHFIFNAIEYRRMEGGAKQAEFSQTLSFSDPVNAQIAFFIPLVANYTNGYAFEMMYYVSSGSPTGVGTTGNFEVAGLGFSHLPICELSITTGGAWDEAAVPVMTPMTENTDVDIAFLGPRGGNMAWYNQSTQNLYVGSYLAHNTTVTNMATIAIAPGTTDTYVWTNDPTDLTSAGTVSLATGVTDPTITLGNIATDGSGRLSTLSCNAAPGAFPLAGITTTQQVTTPAGVKTLKFRYGLLYEIA